MWLGLPTVRQMVMVLADDGRSAEQIAETLSISTERVERIIADAASRRLVDGTDGPRWGERIVPGVTP